MYSLKSIKKKRTVWQKISSVLESTFESENNKSEFNYEDIVEHLDQLVCVKDTKGDYKLANQALCDLIGLEEAEIVGKNDLDLGLFLNPEQIMSADAKVFETGQKHHIPIEPFTDKYGALYWFQTKKIPLKDNQGKVIQLLIISTDITRKTEMEQVLQKSKLRYKAIFQNNYSGIIVINQSLDILNKNKAFNKLLSIAEETQIADDLKNYVSNQDSADLRDLMAGLVSRNYEYFDLNLELLAEEGVCVNTMCLVRGLYDESGMFTEAVVTFQDITTEVKNRKALEESEKRFRVIVENATEALLLLDYDTMEYIDANKKAEELFGYTKEELKELKLGELSPLNQTNGNNSSKQSKEFMDRALVGENVVYDWTVRRKDNKLIPCEVRLVKLPYEGSNIIRTSVIDITERKKAERMINLKKQKLESTNARLLNLNDTLEMQTKQLQEFAYICSHNLRSPAGNIRALLDFYNNEPSEENLILLLEKLDVVSVDLLDTIQDLAGVVQIKNEISEDFISINLAKLIEKASDSLSQEILDKTAAIEVQLNGISSIKASKTYMDSIVLNLFSNALKYAHEERNPSILFTANQDKKYFILSVKDNGLGIDLKKHGEKVFGLRRTFHRNKDSKGIGLFITKAQVEAMEGSISIESELNIGTTFTIRLPKKVIIE
ncbi:MAG: PAS domain S-box-containing protein [Bacteroidia bacterium]|jgi:PAS domain S-box-containing protein